MPSWLIFDVSQKIMRATVKAATITGAFGLGGIVLGFVLTRWANADATTRLVEQHRQEIRNLEQKHDRELAMANREVQLTRFRQISKLISDSRTLVIESEGRTFPMTRSTLQKRFRLQQKIEYLLPQEELSVFLKEHGTEETRRTFGVLSDQKAKLEFALEQLIDSLPDLGEKVSQDEVNALKSRFMIANNEYAEAQIRYWEFVGTLSKANLGAL